MIRVLLVDDHAVVRVGFRMLLQSCEDIQVVAEAGSGEEVAPLMARMRPQADAARRPSSVGSQPSGDATNAGEAAGPGIDVVVMDLSMPGMGGFEALRRLLAHDPAARVLVLSAHEDTVHPRRVLDAGALGYLSKRSAPEVLVEAVRAVAAGQRYLDPQLAPRIALAGLSGAASPVELLSEREFEVFVQLARGRSVADIAAGLKLSPSTVGTHLYNVKQKLQAGNQAELTLIALRWGVIEA
ncbi:MAG TPA: response regulator transcription factor [Burkholderiaceae bacterium]|nr:response regulator transcription factor [Burkholderiaceae bacterium]